MKGVYKYTDWSAECPEFLHVHRLHLEFTTDNYSGQDYELAY